MSHSAGCFGTLFRRRHVSSSAPPRQHKAFPPPSLDDDAPFHNPCCSYSFDQTSDACTIHEQLPPYSQGTSDLISKDAWRIINATIDEVDPLLRTLSLKIHDHPEIMFQERFAHDTLTSFMKEQGFRVTKNYLGMETAWRAEFTKGKGGRVIGINSEMDALKGIGHACGHNLIAVSGCGVAIAIKAALEALDISGKIVLLGTPAEEAGGGKAILLDRGAYEEMDFCVMCHPGPGPSGLASLGSTIAMQSIQVEYFGHSAHAGAAPWEGTNALDAAFVAYSSISALRQQMKPTERVHGIVKGRDWSPNVIPDYAKMVWYVRAPTLDELVALTSRVEKCFEGASLATSCRMTLKVDTPYADLLQNSALGTQFASIATNLCGMTIVKQDASASTDFGNVTYALPALHPLYAIPTEPNGGNHTPGFTKSSATEAAHAATMSTTKALALTGLRALEDDSFYQKVKECYAAQRR